MQQGQQGLRIYTVLLASSNYTETHWRMLKPETVHYVSCHAPFQLMNFRILLFRKTFKIEELPPDSEAWTHTSASHRLQWLRTSLGSHLSSTRVQEVQSQVPLFLRLLLLLCLGPRGCQFLHQPSEIPRNILFDQLTLLVIQCHKKLALKRGADFWCCIIQDHVLAAVKFVSHDSKADTKTRKNTQIAG